MFTPMTVKYKTEKQRDGTIIVKWIPNEATEYRIQILYKRMPIHGSPWTVKVTQKRNFR